MQKVSKKSFNLSLQKKRNHIVLNPIIERCEEDGSYVADRVVDYVEKALFFERSVGLSKVQNTYLLIKNTLASQYPPDSQEFQQRVEDVLRSVIQVDGERLAKFLSDPNDFDGGSVGLTHESRPAVRQAPPAPTAKVEVPEPVRSQSATTDSVQESTLVDDEAERHKREAEDRARKRKEARDERLREEEMAASQEETDGENELDDDDSGISINTDALNNF